MITFAMFYWYQLLYYKEIPSIYWMTLVDEKCLGIKDSISHMRGCSWALEYINIHSLHMRLHWRNMYTPSKG